MDAFGHANHTAYLEWFEEARNHYLEAAGLPPLSATTPGPVLIRLEAQYRKPLAYPDEVLVTARTTALRRTSVTMEYAVWRDGLVARGGCCMADFEHARAMLRMAHKDFNALTGIYCNV